MKTNKSLLKNTFYAFLLQFTSMLFPLITAPYISRVIGVERLGKVNFSSSVVNWFTLIAVFGTTTYGVRGIAKVRDDKDKLNQFFSEMMVIKLITTAVAVIVYLPCISLVDRFSHEYILFLIQGITLLLNIFSLDWFFQGVEDYKYITTRSILMKFISLAALFVMVKNKEDYLIYAGISIFAMSFSDVLNYAYSRKYVRFTWKGLDIRPHMKKLGVFFLSSLIISVYALLDQVLLGFIKSDRDVALYARAKMLLGSGMALSNTISRVIMPRLNNYFVNNKERYAELLRFSANIMLIISIPVMIGMIVLAKMVMILFGGQEFAPGSAALIIIAPLTIIVPIGSWNYQQRMLPLGHEKVALYVQVVMASVSVLFNAILLPRIGFIGAAISYLITETIGTYIGFKYLHKKDGFEMFDISQIKYLIASLGMAGHIMLLQSQLSVSWLSLFVCILTGAIAYFVLLLILRDNMMNIMLKILKGKIRNK